MNSLPSNQQTPEIISPVIGWLAAGSLLVLAAAISWSAIGPQLQARKLAALEAEWAVHHPEFVRLARAAVRLEQMQVANAELNGSWRRTVPVGQLLADCIQRFPDSMSIGKVSLESRLEIDNPDSLQSGPVAPRQVTEAVIAARCFADPADMEILALLDRLQSAPELSSTTESVAFEGVQKNDALENGPDAHTVFALRLGLTPRTLSRERP